MSETTSETTDAGAATPAEPKKPWAEAMPEAQFLRMRAICEAPSPVGFEAAMSFGVLEPMMRAYAPEGWAFRRFRGSAGLVVDTHPGRDDLLTVMLVGHTDKIRLQVRQVTDDGKVWVDSDSFLPLTLLGNEVTVFVRDAADPARFQTLRGATVEAVGAIHFASNEMRAGTSGVKPEQLYLELGLYGDERKKQVEALGIRAGDPILLDRPLRRGIKPMAFSGAYLDNGLGCFVVEELGRMLAERPLTKVRTLLAYATHEEVGRCGSRVLALAYRPDVLIACDVSHDYDAAPGVADKRPTSAAMGKGFTLCEGAVTSTFLNGLILRAAKDAGIPMQRSVAGRDTGTDAMAAVLASIDAAVASVGFPIRNMHTVSETGHTGDVLAAIHVLDALLRAMEAHDGGRGLTAKDLEGLHPRLDEASAVAHGAA